MIENDYWELFDFHISLHFTAPEDGFYSCTMQSMQNMPKQEDNKARMRCVNACAVEFCVVYSITLAGRIWNLRVHKNVKPLKLS